MRGGQNKIFLDEEEIKRLYLEENKTGIEISLMFNVSHPLIYNVLKRFGITKTNSESHKGIRPSNYKGRVRSRGGYTAIRIPIDHPFACMGIKSSGGNGTVLVDEHRFVYANYIGRAISKKEVVHHINKDTADNRIENLMLFESQSEHLKYHKQAALKAVE